MKCSIVLCGLKNCGKTTFGRLLADRLQVFFVDVDRVIEDLYKRDTLSAVSLPVAKIYKVLGEECFRKIEYEAVLVAADLAKTKNIVLATGGGSLLQEKTALLLKKIGCVVYLKVAKGKIKERMFTVKLPAFIDETEPLLSFEKMYGEREGLYGKWADCVVDMERLCDFSDEGVVANIIEKVGKWCG